jgi:hypothetical protein
LNLIGIAIRQSAHPQGIAALTLALSRRERELIEDLLGVVGWSCRLSQDFSTDQVSTPFSHSLAKEKGWG